MEIERKFTIKELPANLDSYPCHHIEQAYLNIAPVVRVRKEDDTYYLTYKGSGMMAREEYNLPLNKESYYHLREKADGKIISKWILDKFKWNKGVDFINKLSNRKMFAGTFGAAVLLNAIFINAVGKMFNRK